MRTDLLSSIAIGSFVLHAAARPIIPPAGVVQVPCGQAIPDNRMHVVLTVSVNLVRSTHGIGPDRHQMDECPTYHDTTLQVESFMNGIHRRAITLGPWETRAVAFAFGCTVALIYRLISAILVLVSGILRNKASKVEEQDPNGSISDDTKNAIVGQDTMEIIVMSPADDKATLVPEERLEVTETRRINGN